MKTTHKHSGNDRLKRSDIQPVLFRNAGLLIVLLILLPFFSIAQSGTGNYFAGSGTGDKNSSGEDNVFIGYRSGYNNTIGNSNSFLGHNAGRANTSGGGNSFFGDNAGKENTTGESNSFFGHNAGQHNNGDNNIFLGHYTGYSNTTGSSNIFIGYDAGRNNTRGDKNSYIGYQSGYSNKKGTHNTFFGYKAGYTNMGSENVFLGYKAGYNENGNNKLYIDNTDTDAPLVYGEFDNNLLRTNGQLEVTGQIKIQGGSPGSGKILTSDANGLASWQELSATYAVWNIDNDTTIEYEGDVNIDGSLNIGTGSDLIALGAAGISLAGAAVSLTGAGLSFAGSTISLTGASLSLGTAGLITAGSLISIGSNGLSLGDFSFDEEGLKRNGEEIINEDGEYVGLITDASLKGKGTSSQPLGLGQQGATNGQILKWNGSSWVPADESPGNSLWTKNGDFLYPSSTSDVVGIGTTNPNPYGKLEVVDETGYVNIRASAYGISPAKVADGGHFVGQYARGTAMAPEAVITGDELISIFAKGYNGTSFKVGGVMFIEAAENWTPSAQGTYIDFYTTKKGSTTHSERMRITDNGSVGIGTTKPNAKLEVIEETGYVNIRASAYGISPANVTDGGHFVGQYARGTATAPEAVQSNDELASIFGVGYNGTNFKPGGSIKITAAENWTSTAQGAYIKFITIKKGSTRFLERMRITDNGSVGIGTTNPGDYKLAVNGHVRAKKIVVESDWADFVFEDDYQLQPLDEVAAYIKKHQHLPGIPAAKHIQEEGLDLGAVQTTMMQKIEELTLYLIDLKAAHEKSCKENQALKERILKLEQSKE